STAQGLMDAWRTGDVAGGEGGWLQDLSCFGREAYYLAPARTILDEFDDALVPSAGLGWGNTYATIRNINSLLHAVDAVGPSMPNDKKEGVRGWAKTIEATLLLRQIRIQDEFGIPIDTDRPLDDLAPIASKDEVYAYILQRFDEAKTHLQGAGAAFGFKLSVGFSGFDTPSRFLEVNRALKARAANDIGDVATTKAALNESFIDAAADMARGAYHSWSAAAGDALMPVSDPQGVRYLADTTLLTDAQSRANGDPDLRVTTKTAPTPAITHTGVTSNLKWRLYADPTSPSPIIKNEELLLIRAEANLDTDAALADINTVRTESGGLEPIALATWQGMSREERITELLYNRRYSLVWEWGHRWVDMRRFGRLDQLKGPRGPGDRVFDKVPFPEDECITRDYGPAGCQTVEGFRTTS
ncbi:MAG TPA: RagB/SusD family nutrient uptake outer membrane protein, partial [Longimicrobiales bacterium]|nr:RagB/SusD family nutrient uptake outer membrane protein [Longimicrobiales bacterium]